MLISIDNFQGMMPAVEPHLLQPHMAKVAQNVNLLKGSLRPWNKELIDTTLEQSDVLADRSVVRVQLGRCAVERQR